MIAAGVTLVSAQSVEGVGRPRPDEVIRLIERVHDGHFDNGESTGPSLGDRAIAASDAMACCAPAIAAWTTKSTAGRPSHP